MIETTIMTNMIKEVVILGGGSSAWLCAAYLSANTEHINITLVDKEVGEPVGVGEATLLNFENFLFNCGFNKQEWFYEIDATYKSGILFPNWGKQGNAVWHPFWLNVSLDNLNNVPLTLYDCWSHWPEEYKFTKLSASFEISLLNKINPTQMNTYAYHIDCGKLVCWLQKKLKDKITIVNSEMTEINRDKNRHITSIKLKNNSIVTGDFFVDCSGFAGLLADNPQRINLDNRLFCNTAVAGHIEYLDRDAELTPFVISEAVEDGWIWRIPVQSRIGSGLVFNRNITSPDQAKINFCRYWEGRITPEQLKIIDWTPYYRNNPWEHNTVAIGLSSGFIEPLESTGLALTQSGIVNICNIIKSHYWTDSDREKYNLNSIAEYNDCVDFVNMHYATSDFDSPFWNWVRKNYQSSNLLDFYLESVSNNDPFLNHGKGILFSGANWTCWLTQLNYPVGIKNTVAAETAKKLLDNWVNFNKTQQVNGINHIDYISMP